MRGAEREMEERGAALVVIGNGSVAHAAAFREDEGIRGRLLVDPELRAYRAAGLRRSPLATLSPAVLKNGWRAMRAGYRPSRVLGDPWQLGGAFVIQPGGKVVLRQVSREAGDHADVRDILAALERAAPHPAPKEGPA